MSLVRVYVCVWISAIASLLPRTNTDFFSGDAGRRNFPLRSLSYPGKLKHRTDMGFVKTTDQNKTFYIDDYGLLWLDKGARVNSG